MEIYWLVGSRMVHHRDEEVRGSKKSLHCPKCTWPKQRLRAWAWLAESHLTSIHRGKAADSGLREFQELFAKLPRDEDRTYPPDLQGLGRQSVGEGCQQVAI